MWSWFWFCVLLSWLAYWLYSQKFVDTRPSHSYELLGGFSTRFCSVTIGIRVIQLQEHYWGQLLMLGYSRASNPSQRSQTMIFFWSGLCAQGHRHAGTGMDLLQHTETFRPLCASSSAWNDIFKVKHKQTSPNHNVPNEIRQRQGQGQKY